MDELASESEDKQAKSQSFLPFLFVGCYQKVWPRSQMIQIWLVFLPQIIYSRQSPQVFPDTWVLVNFKQSS